MATKIKPIKKFKYHVSHSFKIGDRNYSFVTQLYQIGVYGIMNSDSAMQGSYTPNNMVNMEKKLKKDFENNEITDLTFGREITVTTDEHGFYIEC